MEYAIEIGSNCNFQVSQGSVETYLGEMANLDNVCVQNFLRNLAVKEVWNRSTFAEVKIKRQVYFLRHSVFIPSALQWSTWRCL